MQVACRVRLVKVPATHGCGIELPSGQCRPIGQGYSMGADTDTPPGQ